VLIVQLAADADRCASATSAAASRRASPANWPLNEKGLTQVNSCGVLSGEACGDRAPPGDRVAGELGRRARTLARPQP